MPKKSNRKKTNNGAESRAEIARVATEVLEDPDFGKKLSTRARKRLASISDKDLSEAVSISGIKK